MMAEIHLAASVSERCIQQTVFFLWQVKTTAVKMPNVIYFLVFLHKINSKHRRRKSSRFKDLQGAYLSAGGLNWTDCEAETQEVWKSPCFSFPLSERSYKVSLEVLYCAHNLWVCNHLCLLRIYITLCTHYNSGSTDWSSAAVSVLLTGLHTVNSCNKLRVVNDNTDIY